MILTASGSKYRIVFRRICRGSPTTGQGTTSPDEAIELIRGMWRVETLEEHGSC